MKTATITHIRISGIKYTILLFLSLLFTSLFSQNKMNFIEKIIPKDRQADDQFGWNIDSDSSFLIAGIPHSVNWINNKEIKSAGAVYIYKIENKKVVFHQKIFAPISKEESSFGTSVALYKNLLVIGSQRYRERGQSEYETEGGIYIYRLINDNWEFEQFFINPNKANKNRGRFGVTVDIYGDYIIAGDGLFNSSLSLIKYQNGVWKITDMIIDKDTTFGCDASIYGKSIVIGSKNYTNDKGKVVQKGKVYIYSIDSNDKLKLQNTITPNLKDNFDRGFGSEVNLYDNVLLVGAETSNPLDKSGALYVYNIDRQTNTFKLDTLLKSDFPLNGDWYGHSFDMFKNILVVGAMGNTMYNNMEAEYIGAVYIYEKMNGKWNLIKKEYSTNPTSWDKYGFSVSIFNSNIFIGCRLDDEDMDEKNRIENTGAIYRYEVLTK